MRSLLAMALALGHSMSFAPNGIQPPKPLKFWSALTRNYWDKPGRNSAKFPFNSDEVKQLANCGGRFKKDLVKSLKKKYS